MRMCLCLPNGMSLGFTYCLTCWLRIEGMAWWLPQLLVPYGDVALVSAPTSSRLQRQDPCLSVLTSPSPTKPRSSTLPSSTWKRIVHQNLLLKSSHEDRFPMDLNFKSNLFLLIHQRCCSNTLTHSLWISSVLVEEFNQKFSLWITGLFDFERSEFSFWFVLPPFFVLQILSPLSVVTVQGLLVPRRDCQCSV